MIAISEDDMEGMKNNIEKALEGIGLADFQIRHLMDVIEGFVKVNACTAGDMSRPVSFEVCPKCGVPHPVINKAGFSNSGKQMYRCKFCGKRFVWDHGQITYYSHQDPSLWKQLIADTLSGVPIRESAEFYKRNPSTIFHMRHRLLAFLDDAFDYEQLSRSNELDETFVLASHKGWHDEDLPVRKHRGKASCRGLSNEQVCICGAVDVDGKAAFLRAYNAGTLSAEDAMNLAPHLQSGCHMITDGNTSYNRLAGVLSAKRSIVGDCTDHYAPENLNSINSLHSKFKQCYREYRGVASKYINRYASCISLAWNLRNQTDDAKLAVDAWRFIGSRRLVGVKISTLQEYRKFAPADLRYPQDPA